MRTFLLSTYSPALADLIGKEGPGRAVTLVGNFPDADAFVSAIRGHSSPFGFGLTMESLSVLRSNVEAAKIVSDLAPNVVHIEVGEPSTETRHGNARAVSEVLSEAADGSGAPDTPATHTLASTEVLTEEGIVYTPWTDGRALGFKATAPDGRVEYVILNPSGASEGSEGEVFVYAAPTPNFADDGTPVTFVPIFQRDDAQS